MVSTTVVAGVTSEDELQRVERLHNAKREAPISGRGLPSHDVQYVAAKSGEAERSISEIMSQGVLCRGDSPLMERSELRAVTEVEPDEEGVLGSSRVVR